MDIELRRFLPAAGLLLLTALPAAAQPNLTLPPAGDNQKSSVTQHMGLVAVTIEYNSVDVHSPAGEDRKGKIWGQLVPWGMADLGFIEGRKSPWRVGANENTTFVVTHDVEIEGKKLPAGKYGLHMIPAQNGDWTLIFSKNAGAWGSYFYDEKDDALRVPVKAEPAPAYSEWLNFTFLDRQLDTSLAALEWENLRVPFRIRVPNTLELYVNSLRRELTGNFGFDPAAFNTAANFLLQRDTEGKYLEQSLAWANSAVNPPTGRRNFDGLITLATALDRLGRSEEAKKARTEALADPAVTPLQIHFHARQLSGMGKHQDALAVFQENARRFPGQWPTELGLARGYAGVGDTKKALEHAKKALAGAPDPAAKANVEGLIARLEKGEKL